MSLISRVQQSSKWWPATVIVLTLLAFGLRWYFVITAQVDHPIRGDATQYFAYAWNLAQHGTFAKNPPGTMPLIPDSYRDPGYPLFLAIWMKLLGDGEGWYAGVLLCQALLGALTVTFAMQTGRLWLSRRWAAVAGLRMAVWPHSIAINSYLLTETLFGFLCSLAILLCARACIKQNPGLGFTAGLTMGAAALTNAILLPFGILLALMLGGCKLTSRKMCFALALGALLLPAAWAVRNAQLPASSSDSSARDRALQNLAQGFSPLYHQAYRESIFGDPASRRNGQIILRQIDSNYQQLRDRPLDGIRAMVKAASERPLRYLSWYLIEKPASLWGWSIEMGQGDIYVYPTANSPFRTRHSWIALEALCEQLNPLIFLLALGTAIFQAIGRRRADPITSAPLASVILLFACVTAIYCTLQAEPRYSIPFRSFELLLAVTGLTMLLKGYGRIRQQRKIPAGEGQMQLHKKT